MFRKKLAEIQVAITLLSRLPAGRIPTPLPNRNRAAWAFPFVGLPVGGIAWAAYAGTIHAGLGPVLAVLAMLIASAMATGAMHLDGLADFTDGVGGGRNRAHALKIMRDSAIGTYGTIALILTLAIWGVSVEKVAGPAPRVEFFLLAAVASRLVMLAAMVRMEPARDDGLGHSVADPTMRSLVPGVLLVAGLAGWIGVPALIPLAATGVAAVQVARLANRKIGGQTGDVLGAVQVVAETVCWLAMVV